ncbi:MAG: hypothetical protein ACTSSH_03450 [Candidatus Heimdallarchaeota archaeon]
MSRQNSFLRLQKSNTRTTFLILIVLVIGLVALQLSIMPVAAEDDDDDDDDDDNKDIAKDLGWVAVGLLVVSSLYVPFYQLFKITRKIDSEGKRKGFKDSVAKVFRKLRKPFQYIHYFSGLAALGVLIAHGVFLTKDDAEAVIGWVSAGIYVFYILTGMLIWFKIIHPKRNKKLRKVVLYIHRSLLLFAIVIIIHIVHVVISD